MMEAACARVGLNPPTRWAAFRTSFPAASASA